MSAVGEDDRCSDSGGDSDTPEGHDIGVVDEPWNTPEGWAKVKAQADMYFAQINHMGHVCSVCGERRHDGKEVHAEVIKSWGVGYSVSKDLTRVLYPQYPDERVVKEVCCFVWHIIVMIRRTSTGSAAGVKTKARALRRRSRRLSRMDRGTSLWTS